MKTKSFEELKNGVLEKKEWVLDKWHKYKTPIKVIGTGVSAITCVGIGFALGRKDILEGECGSFGFYEDPEIRKLG